MSLTDLNKIHNYSFHRRNDSEELDVFEAARYFSAADENSDNYPMINVSNFSQESIREEVQKPPRMRLDSLMRNPIPSHNHAMHPKKIKEIRGSKQPSSPGGRVASLMNLLFSQTSSKKHKPKSFGTRNDLRQEIPDRDGRKKGRSSKIHTGNLKDTADADLDLKAMYSCSSSVFRSPLFPFSNSPTKNEEAKHRRNMKAKSLHDAFSYFDRDYLAWNIEDKLRFGLKNSAVKRIERECASEEKGSVKFVDADDGADTDSSSDLFDLPNLDLDDVSGNGFLVTP